MTTTTPLSLNGEALRTDSATLHDLLRQRGYDLGGAFACAVNGRFVPRPQWPQCRLQPDDRIDVVSPVTGG